MPEQIEQVTADGGTLYCLTRSGRLFISQKGLVDLQWQEVPQQFYPRRIDLRPKEAA
jgi:hypothetical protein